MDEELPFELYKKHKTITIWNWKKNGLVETNEMILEIYEGSIRTSNCELCGNPFKNLKDRQMDHDHLTGKFRNIVCQNCNRCKSDKKFSTNTGERFITKVLDKNYKQGFYYTIRISRNSKLVLCKCVKTLEEAIEVRDEFILENPEYFT